MVTALRIPGGIALDGQLREELWQNIVPASEFIQTEPLDGQPSTERTEVFVLYDHESLYIGARLYDQSGDVRSRLGRRDSHLADSDWLYISLDAQHDHRTAYQFSVNPAGVKRDEISTGGNPDNSWDAVWDAATSVDSAGWTVEIRIPFSQLRFNPGSDQLWGLQLSRRINRKQEVVVLAHTPKREPGGVPRFAHLLGLRDLQAGKKLVVLPYTTARAEYQKQDAANPFRDGSDFFGGTGVDVKYRVTSNLTLDATVNPDFGQVEQDPAVVNLSAYETSLQERRPFFVEGNNIFSFGNSGNGRGIYYSRRIGRTPQGSLPSGTAFSERPDASTILGAAKLSGRTPSGWSIGVLGALTAEERVDWVNSNAERGSTEVEPTAGYAVTRLQRSMREGQSNVGGIFTLMKRDLSDPALEQVLRSSAYAGGFDFTHAFLNRSWSIEGQITGSHVNGSAPAMLRTQLTSSRYYNRVDADYLAVDSSLNSLSGYSARFEIGKRSGLHWRGEASVSTTSPGYEINDAGFQTLVDRTESFLNVNYVENRPGRIFRNYRIETRGNTSWNYGGDFVDGKGTVSLNGQLLNYWGGNLSFTHSVESVDDRLTRGGPAARDPSGNHIGGNINSDNRRALSGRINASYSWNALGGWHQNGSLNLDVRPADSWSFSVGPRLDRSITHAQYVNSVTDSLMTSTYGRRFIFSELMQTTVSMDTRVNVNFTPNLSLEVYAQPFISSGDYRALMQLGAARTHDFQRFGSDIGSVTYDDSTRYYTVDPDANGPAASFTVRNNDFSSISLRGNAVMRWEWRPGSTIFLVWQQRRANSLQEGDFDFGRNAGHLFNGTTTNVFAFKLNYWLNL